MRLPDWTAQAIILMTAGSKENGEIVTRDRAVFLDGEDGERLEILLEAFKKHAGLKARFVVRAPGRVNLIGEQLVLRPNCRRHCAVDVALF